MLRLQGVFSLFIQLASMVRRWMYRVHLRKATRVARPVVSIGNISFGGTGKTPVVIALAQALSQRGFKVCVLTRGYRRKKTTPTALVQKTDSPRDVGDEPLLMAQKTNAHVVVDARRARAAAWAVQHFAPDVFLLDDGFSHLRIARDLDIVMLSRTDHLPLYRRREPRSALRSADILMTLEANVPNALHIERRVVNDVKGKRVWAMAAIANPERFSSQLSSAGAVVVGSTFFHDHHFFPEGALDDALTKADFVAITEKDAVKISPIPDRVLVIATEVVLPEAVVERVVGLLR